MNLLKKIFDLYINASIHVALSVYSFVRITELYFGLAYNESLDLFFFYATITGYNFVKYAGVAKFHHISLTTHLKIIQIFSIICFLLMCFYASKLSLQTLLFFTSFGLLTILYAIPFFSKFQKNLRSIGYLKIIIVAVVWLGVSVLLPVFDIEKEFTRNIYLYAIQRFLLVVVLILPFEIRDMKYDVISLQTIPREIGIENTKKLGYILLLICLLLEFIIVSEVIFRNVFLIIFVSLLFLLMRSKIQQSKYYSSFFVEVIPIFWWLLFLIIQNFN